MATRQKPQKVLFLCTGNSARSIFAEFFMNKIGLGRFEAYSAGNQPAGTVNPFTIRVLRDEHNMDPAGARAKSWDEFKDMRFDIVITVCDRAKESCPVFSGQPTVAHWSIPDPALATGSDEQKLRQFRDVALEIKRRIELLCSVPTEQLDHF